MCRKVDFSKARPLRVKGIEAVGSDAYSRGVRTEGSILGNHATVVGC
jgi:hypothetical protein